MADRWSARHGHGNDRLVLVDHASLPSLQTNRLDAVSIEYVAGFGVVDANQPVFPYTFPIVFGSGREFVNSVPDDLRHAIALLVSHWYENRESTVVGTIASQVPQTVDALIQPHRVLGY
jgi:hypothetical protein